MTTTNATFYSTTSLRPIGKHVLSTLLGGLVIFLASMLLTACGQKGAEEYQKGVAALDNKEYEAAAEAFRKSADKGCVNAQIALAVCYTNGKGVGEDKEEGKKWLRKAAESDDPIALALYGASLLPEEEGFKYLEKSANKGNPAAMVILGMLYEEMKDNKKAVEYIRKAAEQPLTGKKTVYDELSSLNELPFEFSTEKDICTLDKVVILAQAMLAESYANGKGVENDPDEAMKWLEKAQRNGLPQELYQKIKQEIHKP